MSDKDGLKRVEKVHVGEATILVITLNNDLRPINTTGFKDLAEASKYAKLSVNANVRAALICPVLAAVMPACSVEVKMSEENRGIFFPNMGEPAAYYEEEQLKSRIESA